MHKQQRLAVRRPAMKVSAVNMRDRLRLAAFRRNHKYMRATLAREIATDRQPLAIRREAMAAVAARRSSNVDRCGLAAGNRNLHDLAPLVEEEAGAVACPVGGFEVGI